MNEKTALTKQGLEKLKEELRELIDVTREEVKKQLAEARAQGDLSENADYDAARNKQAEVEARIKELENIINNCTIIDDSSKNKNKVSLGATVTVEYLATGKQATYKIVGTVESDPFNGMISNECPLGEAVVGKQVGDVVDVKSSKPYQIKIVKFEIK